MKKTRIIALLLVLATMLALLASCDAAGIKGDGGDREGDSWDGVNFDGQEVHVSVSVNQYEECSFPAADIYTKGPDTAGSNEVAKEVLARNARVADEIGINIKYSTTNLRYPDVFEDIKNIVMTSAKNSPDIYSNDLIGLGKAMVSGYLWNVKNPGDDVKNYFDFTKEGWYQEYIKGCTFDQNKLYIFAGDYFIDMIRMAWVIYVNEDILNANIDKLAWDTMNDFYADVEAGLWTIDDLAEAVSSIHTDGAGGVMGEADTNDDIIGMSINHTTDWVFASSSGVNVYYQDKTDGYKPKVVESIDTFQKVSDKWVAFANAKAGVITTASSVEGVKEATTIFLGGKTLFAASRLGEMESDVLRNFSASKGIVPFPKWSRAQDDYHTVIHNQVELGAILNTAQAFSAASALMQFLNEESDQVIYTYYEKGLKYKYNDNKNARVMMDLIRETSDSPFGFEIGDLCHEMLYTGTSDITGMYLDNNATISSTFAAEKGVYKDCLEKMLQKFAEFE